MSRTNSGGRAMSGGAEYQSRVSSWGCCHILLQSSFSDRYSLDLSDYPEKIYCETDDFVDDIRIEFNSGTKLFAQCKRKLSYSELSDSEWSDVVKQFYYQYLYEDQIDSDFQLVLFLQDYNRNWRSLSQLLTRYRGENSDIDITYRNRQEESILLKLDNLFNLLEEEGLSEINGVKNKLLQKIYVQNLDLSEESESFIAILDNIGHNLITSPDQVRITWDVIKGKTDSLHSQGGTTNRHELRKLLNSRGIQLQDSLYFRNDFITLNSFSQESYSNETRYNSVIRIGDESFTIQRHIIQEVVENEDSFIILGEAGVGKTGILLAFYNEFENRGRTIWYWPVESLQGETIYGLNEQLGLENTWDEIFSEIRVSNKPVLLLDGLDGLKNHNVKKAYLELIRKALFYQIQVIASIRTFDLRYSIELKELFKRDGASIFHQNINEEFRSVNHYQVSPLTDEELNQIRDHFDQLDSIISAFPRLLTILRNLFNLHILCNLISDDDDDDLELSETNTQTQLFDLFWEKRINSSEYRVGIINNLRDQINNIVTRNQLGGFSPGWGDDIHNYLCSVGIVREYRRGSILIPGMVEFSHNLFFDYFAEQLFVLHLFSSNETHFINSIQNNEPWSLFLRPSLRMFYLRLFKEGPSQFWELLITYELQNVPLIQKYLAYLTIAENSVIREDLDRVITELSSQNQLESWESVLKGLVNAAVHSILSDLFSIGSGDWWLAFAFELVQIENLTCKDYSRRILFTASDNYETLSPQGLSLFNETSRYLLNYYWNNAIFENMLTRLPIKCICESISSHHDDSIEILRQVLSDEELHRSGYIQAYEITRNIEKIWRVDPSFASEVYRCYTSYREIDQSSTSINFSQIMSLTSNKTQQYNSGFYLLSEKISDFFNEFPLEANDALIQSVENFVSRERTLDSQNNFSWNNQECTIVSDYGNIWDHADSHSYEVKMLSEWESYLISLPSKTDVDEIYAGTINRIIRQNRLASIWRRLLHAGSQVPSFYAQKLWDLLTINRILIQPELRESIKDCLESFFPLLNEQNKREIYDAILAITIDDAVVDDPIRIADIERNMKLSYLVCIPREYHTSEVRRFLEVNGDYIPEQRRREGPFFKMHAMSNDDIRRFEGINIDSSPYRELTNSSQFIDELKTNELAQNNYQNILSRVNSLESRLIELEEHIEIELYDIIKNKVIKGLSIIASGNVIFEPSEIETFITRFNQELRINQNITQEQLEAYDSHQAFWSSNDYYASEGIVQISLNLNDLSEQLKDSLLLISRHPKPVIKSNLGLNIWRFIDTWPSFVWQTLERWCDELRNSSGMKGIFKLILSRNLNWFWILRKNNESRALSFLNQLRASSRMSNANEILNHYGGLLSVLYVRDNETWTEPEINSIIENVQDNIDEAKGVLELCNSFVFSRSPIDFNNLPILLRAKRLLVEILQNGYLLFQTRERDVSPNNTEIMGKIFSLFSYTTTQFRVSSKIQSDYWLASNTERLNSETWWSLIDPIISQFEQFPHPSYIHDIIQGIESLMVIDIAKSISWLSMLIEAGAQMNISNERLIVDKTVSILETVLTMHTNLIIIDENFRNNFFGIIEILLVNGWPKVIQIAINLDSIYR